MTKPVIEVANVSKILGSGPSRVQALKNVSLALYGGKLTLLIGPSGSTWLSLSKCNHRCEHYNYQP